MKLLFDLFPVILFFIVFKTSGIYAATAAAMVATAAQIAWSKWRHGSVEKMLWVSFGIITVMGGATLLLHDESFIKWKPTILYWVFSAVLIVSSLVFRKNPLKAMMRDQIALPNRIWTRLNIAWSLFFAALGMLNIYVAQNYPTETWVNFKLFGSTALLFVFIVAQSLWMAKYIEQDKEHN